MARGFRIGRLLGIELRVDSSWLLIFALVTWSLTSVFSGWHPNWTTGTSVAVALVSAVMFFASVVFHEMAHSLVARAYGIPVRDITLHMFGGVSNIERNPPTPAAELFIAIVGPIASIVLGGALMVAGALMTDLSGPSEEAAAQLGPIGTLVMWLGPVNVMVGLFNLVPGFPLDGGRVLRAILWRTTGSLKRATEIAASVGQGLGWTFVALGVVMALGIRVPFFGRGLASGAWLAMIGFFLRNAAVRELAGIRIDNTLEGLRVSDLMRRRGGWVPLDLPLDVLVEGWFMQYADRAYPVLDGTELVGMVSLDDVKKIGAERWSTLVVRDAMVPRAWLRTTTPDELLSTALQKLGATEAAELPVLENGTLAGMLFEEDVARFIERRPAFPTRPRHA